MARDVIHEIGLVAASRRQRGTICRAADQFDPSPVFRRARQYCERAFDEWYILTPHYPLALPHQVLGPSTTRIAELCAVERGRWSAELSRRLYERCLRSPDPVRFVLFCGARTAELVARAVPFAEIVVPHAGLSLAERMHWYDERLRREERTDSRVLAAVKPRRDAS